MNKVQLILLLSHGIFGLVITINVDTVIVGAGPSGFAAASRLLNNGVTNFVVLESKNRFGGRVNTVPFADSIVEMGAQWVHGQTGNIVFELASPLDLLNYDPSRIPNVIFREDDGDILTSNESLPIYYLYYGIAGDLENNQVQIPPLTSWGDYFTQKFKEAYAADPFTTQERFDEALSFLAKADCSVSSSDSWNQVSARLLGLFKTCDGDQLISWKNNGYRTIFDILQNKFSNNSLDVVGKIKLGTKVKNIDYTNMHKSIVTTKNGTVYNAKHVIFTPSLGVLKRHHLTLFTPPLPRSKQKAIQGVAFGSVLKFFLEYTQAWWPTDLESYALLWSEKDRKNFIAANGKDKKWLCDVFDLIAMNNQPRVLEGWSYGKSARFSETLTDAQMMDQLHLLITTIFQNQTIPKPTNIRRSKWFSDNDTYGTYSYDSLDTERMNVSRNDLAEPIQTTQGKPVILFAGEATNVHHYSTVHGAIETGFREADRLLTSNTQQSPKNTKKLPTAIKISPTK